MAKKVDESKYSEKTNVNAPLNAGSEAARNDLIGKLKKSFGEESLQVGPRPESVAVSTGSLLLDLATGIGGLPRSRITQITGWESSGKTTLSLKAAANIQAKGGVVAFIDTEYAFDEKWAKQLGVNTDKDKFEYIAVDSLETAGETAVALAESGLYDMIILDSVAGAPIKAVISGDLGDSNMGKRAKIMSDFMPKLNGPVSRNNVWMVITNQLRDSLNIYNPRPAKPGGHALDFHASLSLLVRGKLKDDIFTTRVNIEKNKLASTVGKSIEFLMDRNGYIDQIDEVASLIVNPDYQERFGITQTGAYYTLPVGMFPEGENRFHGKARITEALADVEVLERVLVYLQSKF